MLISMLVFMLLTTPALLSWLSIGNGKWVSAGVSVTAVEFIVGGSSIRAGRAMAYSVISILLMLSLAAIAVRAVATALANCSLF
ncbi:hypothetical protein BASA60_009685 [Batrachochytrium salamandrivorans]|nr:hypothetical protein BASA60_009685 [Batrachochytrium salamandrivorans]